MDFFRNVHSESMSPMVYSDGERASDKFERLARLDRFRLLQESESSRRLPSFSGPNYGLGRPVPSISMRGYDPDAMPSQISGPSDDPGAQWPAPGTTAATLSCVRALYDYTTSVPGELNFKKNDIIAVLESVWKDWGRGSLRGQIGIFPLDYVEKLQAAVAGSRVRALYDFTPSEPNDLAFKKNDVIAVLEIVYKDWGRGSLRGRIGIFPLNYVEKLQDATKEEPERDAQTKSKVFGEMRGVEKLLRPVPSLPRQDGQPIFSKADPLFHRKMTSVLSQRLTAVEPDEADVAKAMFKSFGGLNEQGGQPLDQLSGTVLTVTGPDVKSLYEEMRQLRHLVSGESTDEAHFRIRIISLTSFKVSLGYRPRFHGQSPHREMRPSRVFACMMTDDPLQHIKQSKRDVQV
jgi:hypothetical protein